MRRRAGVLLLTLLSVYLASRAAAADRPLRMKVRPEGFAFAPTDLEVRLFVTPGGRGRAVLLEIDGPKYYRSSVSHIREEIDTPSPQQPAWYRSLPDGEYVITATLSDCAREGCGSRQQLARAEHRLKVLEGFPQ